MKENSLNGIILISSLSIVGLVIVMILIYAFFVTKKTKLLLHQKQRENEFEQELTQAQIEIKEETLSYIGRELHDDLGQKLSVARLYHNQMLYKMQGERHEELSQINQLLGECIQDIRNLSKTLITEQVEHFGLIDCLQLEVKKLKKLNYINVQLQFNQHDIDISSKHALILFRMIQECINNTLKHAKATELKITIEDTKKTLAIQLQDNGTGFNTQKDSNGSGLQNLKYRSSLINAKLHIESLENTGTTIAIKYQK